MAHLYPLRDVCMQYENNTANSSRDIVRKQNTASVLDIVLTISPAPKKRYEGGLGVGKNLSKKCYVIVEHPLLVT